MNVHAVQAHLPEGSGLGLVRFILICFLFFSLILSAPYNRCRSLLLTTVGNCAQVCEASGYCHYFLLIKKKLALTTTIGKKVVASNTPPVLPTAPRNRGTCGELSVQRSTGERETETEREKRGET